MTKREAAIVSAYTGFLLGSFSDMQEYIESVMGRPVWTHELINLPDTAKAQFKRDFVALEVK